MGGRARVSRRLVGGRAGVGLCVQCPRVWLRVLLRTQGGDYVGPRECVLTGHLWAWRREGWGQTDRRGERAGRLPGRYTGFSSAVSLNELRSGFSSSARTSASLQCRVSRKLPHLERSGGYQ